MDTSGDSSMDTNGGTAATSVGAIASVVANAASLTLVKAERPDHLTGTSTSPATVTAVATGPIGTGNNLFSGIANSNKTARSDDWLATNSPGSPQNSLQSQHVVYSTSQQQLSEQQPSMAHSSPLAHQQVSNNGYASPMSTGSYDPYSPNGKIDYHGREQLHALYTRRPIRAIPFTPTTSNASALLPEPPRPTTSPNEATEPP